MAAIRYVSMERVYAILSEFLPYLSWALRWPAGNTGRVTSRSSCRLSSDGRYPRWLIFCILNVQGNMDFACAWPGFQTLKSRKGFSMHLNSSGLSTAAMSNFPTTVSLRPTTWLNSLNRLRCYVLPIESLALLQPLHIGEILLSARCTFILN